MKKIENPKVRKINTAIKFI